MKRGKRLLLLLLLLVLAVAFYLAATFIAKEAEDTETEPEETTITVVDTIVSKVTSFSYKTPDREIGILKEDGTYTYTPDPTFPLDQIVASDILKGVTEIVFTRKLEGDDLDLAEYGLDEPSIVIEAAYSDETPAVILKLGDYNKHADIYYCDIGDGAVYLLAADFLDTFDVDQEDLLQDEYIKEKPDDIDCITEIEVVFRDGSGFTYTPEEVEIPAETTGSGETSASSTPKTDLVWSKTLLDGTAVEGDFTEKAELLYKQMFEVKLEGWAAYNVTGKEALGAYGLAEPAVKVTVRYEDTVIIAGDENTSNVTQVLEKVMGFLIGDLLPAENTDSETAETEETAETAEPAEADATEEESKPQRYFMLEGGKIVYILDEANLSAALS